MTKKPLERIKMLPIPEMAIYTESEVAAIRQQAQAEAFAQAASLEKNEMEAIRKMGGEHMEVEVLKSKIRLNSILNLSPIPNYRERIVAQARQTEAEWWFAHQLCRDKFVARLNEIEAELAHLARLAAADAEKPAEGEK